MDSGIGFVVAAYAVTWLVFGVYALRLRAVLRRARDEYVRSGGGK